MAGTDLIDVNAFGAGPAAIFQGQPKESLAAGIGQSYGILRYKGKTWSLFYRGERKNLIRPDDGTPATYIDVIITGAADHKSKSYYPSYDPNSDGEQPLCASMDGLVPDVGVKQQQAQTCALCPRNEWKMMANGKKGRDCSDYKRLAVMLMPNVTQALLGTPLMEPVFLRVPPASLQNLAMLGEQMEARGYEFYTYITRITFDPNEAHPKMIFRGIKPLTEEEGKVVLALRKDPQCDRIVNGEMRQALTAPVSPQGTPQQPQIISPAPVQAEAPAPSIIMAPASSPPLAGVVLPAGGSGLGANGQSGSALSPTATTPSTPSPAAPSLFGGVTPPSVAAPPTQPLPGSTVNGSGSASAASAPAGGDTGVALADDDLNARIAALLPPQ